ncbi:hypothetical protein AB32_1708 [Escherichia coli 2-316-03_S1_C2]|nr:hypothetical protein AC12_1747 [Escherichia coli 2-005-03_S3_C2]KEJ27897.1 hypothetical protein AB03_1808 [Escherichia coli 2-316-03_S1_C1]KEJ30401.1 hypothetical protein AB32_1708 [Escherichia coli 2-316-03_S1_C2]
MRYGASIALAEISQHAASLKNQNISRYWGSLSGMIIPN